MAVAGIALLGYAGYSYVAQRQFEAQLEAQVPGQSTSTPAAALASEATPPAVVLPSLSQDGVSPSVTPFPTAATPVQPDATAAADLARTPTAILLTGGARLLPLPTDGADYNNLTDKPAVTPTPTTILAGVTVPTPASGAPTVLAAPSQPQGVPRGSGSPGVRLMIPKLKMNLAILQADYFTYQSNGQVISDWNVPYGAAGHLSTTAQPGEIGNAVLSGHHNLIAPNTFGLGAFAGLWNLTAGDQVNVQTADGKTQVWRVADSYPVKEGGEPLAVRIQNAQKVMSDGPTPTLTLLTCWNGKTNPLSGNTYRWVVRAELVGIN